ncbi:hypothetical protein ES707_18985 [subsurface metagenome]
MEIFCKNCKYFIDYTKEPRYERRHYCKFVKRKIKHYKGEQMVRSIMEYLNQNGDCPYYKKNKKKWWRRR